MSAFADDDVLLLILDRLETVREITDFSLDGRDSAWAVTSATVVEPMSSVLTLILHVYDTVHVEAGML
jgi:hypothetical protein